MRARTNRLACLNRYRHTSREAYLVAGVTIVGAALCFAFLASKSLWLDEAVTAQEVSSLAQLIWSCAHGQEPLYHLIMYVWVRIAGDSEWMLRTPSALCAVATIPLIAELGSELSDRATGILSAVLLTVHETAIQYAQIARAYSMAIMLVTLWSIYFLRSVKQARPKNYLGYIIAGVLCSYTHLFAILMIPAQWGSLFFFRRDRETTKRLHISMLAILILSVPAFLIVREGDRVNWISPTSLRGVIQFFYVLAGSSRDIVPGSSAASLNFMGSRNIFSVPLLVLYLAAIALAAIDLSRHRKASQAYVLLCLTIPVCLAIVASFLKPLFVPRYLLITLPFFVLAGAMGIRTIPSRTAAVAVITLMVVFSLAEDFSLYRAPSFQDWRGTVQLLAKRAQPSDVLMIYPGFYETPLSYYLARLPVGAPFPRMLPLEAETDLRHPERLANAIAQNRSKASNIGPSARIWLVGVLYRTNRRLLDELRIDHHIAEHPNISGVNLLLMVPDGR